MGYLAPSFEDLGNSSFVVAEEYEAAKKKYGRRHRDEVPQILKLTYEFILQQDLTNKIEIENAAHAAYAGLWIFYRKSIHTGYHLWNADFQEGYFFNTGSILRPLLTAKLAITEENKLDDEEELENISVFYNFFFSENPDLQTFLMKWKEFLAAEKIKTDKIKLLAETVMRKILHDDQKKVNGILHAVPTDEAISKKLVGLNKKYDDEKKLQAATSWFGKFQSVNPERKFAAQLSEAVNEKIQIDDSEDLNKKNRVNDPDISRSQQKRMGAIIYMMRAIDSGFYNDSRLYKLLDDALQAERLKHYPSYTEWECLETFKNYIRGDKVLEFIENYGKDYFKDENYLRSIDRKVNDLLIEIEPMIADAKRKAGDDTNWPITSLFRKVGFYLLCGPIFFGIGSLGGLMFSQTNLMSGPTRVVGNVITTASSLLGVKRNFLGLMAANYIIPAAAIRSGGKNSEQIGWLASYVLFSAPGAALDITAKILKRFLCVFVYLNDNSYQPMLIRNVNPSYIRTLLSLPECVFPEDKHKKLEKKLENENLEIVEKRNLGPKR